MSVYFRALADRKRLRVVEYLAERDRMTVTQLGEEMRLSQPLISWHLRILRKAGIVKTQRSGRQVWFSLNRPALEQYQRVVSQKFGLKGTAEPTPREESELLEPISNQ